MYIKWDLDYDGLLIIAKETRKFKMYSMIVSFVNYGHTYVP